VSRRDIPEDRRLPFRAYFDELITLTGAAPETIAAMFEDFRKYKVHVHGMTQLLAHLPNPVRLSLAWSVEAYEVTMSSTPGSPSMGGGCRTRSA
jgi:hypothetical protein